MNTFKKISRQDSGFTLVELMIVVAIIGILASIAIPNYQKYQAKARTSEAKIYLSAAFTAEKSFVVEYSSFTGCLAAAGFAPDTSQRYYTVGYSSGGPATCGQDGASSCVGNLGTNAPTCAAGNSTSDHFVALVKARSDLTIPVQASLPASTPTSNGFTVGAAGAINPASATPSHDRWTITQDKALSQTTIGY